MEFILDSRYSKELSYFLSPLFYTCISYAIHGVLVYSTVNYKLYPSNSQQLTTRDILGLYAWNVIGMAVLCLVTFNYNENLLFKMWLLVIPVSTYSTYKGLQKRVIIIDRNKKQELNSN